MSKIKSRVRRAAKTKAQIKRLGVPSIVIFRSNKHIYAQVVESTEKGNVVKTSASSKEKEFEKSKGNKVDLAKKVGELLGKRIVESGLKSLAFDRSGYKYHGRVKALAEGVREQGVEI